MTNAHPLSEDLSKLSADDLDKKYNELLKRHTIARRMNMGSHILYQLDLMLDGIELEKQQRNAPPEDTKKVVIDTDKQ
jgi:hypothetical protein